MANIKSEVCIVGSGFGGSLLAVILQKLGISCVVIDRAAHPRFAIGESSTPIANRVLRDLCDRYDLPQFRPLSAYGPAEAFYPQVTMGLKRGFSYFKHTPDERVECRSDHANELLVAASADDHHADTHWLRADVDAVFARHVEQLFENTTIINIDSGPPWNIAVERDDSRSNVQADFIVDGSGQSGALLGALGVESSAAELRTNSRAIFGHFENVLPWPGHDDHPFDCNHAALHHIIDEGWMWQLRFRNDVTSAGFAIDANRVPLDPNISAEVEWQRLLNRYPSIADQFRDARVVAPDAGIQRTGRLQRLAGATHGLDWVALPNTIGFVDPLHSTGIAQTMCAVERLAAAFEKRKVASEFNAGLDRYGAAVEAEFRLIDLLVDGCYRTRGQFDVFTTFVMTYFAAATTYERRRHEGERVDAMLCADDQRLCEIARDVYDWNVAACEENSQWPISVPQLQAKVAERIAPFNHVGLCDPTLNNMYRYTAAPHSDG